MLRMLRAVAGLMLMSSVVVGCATGGEAPDVGVTQQAVCAGFDAMNPDPAFCSGACTCGVGQGDCDNDADCDPGLMCRKDVGATYGLPADYDVCEAITNCPRFPRPKSLSFCTTTCPCGEGEGGCTFGNDATCDTGLTCFQDRGPSIGFSTSYDVCFAACPPFDATKPNTSFCTAQCPCDFGEGDCDSDAQCAQGVCVADIGASVGLPADWDVCECPVFNVGTPSTTFCSAACPCAAGEGNCTDDTECDAGLQCTPNVGANYGLPADYHVCEPIGGTSCPAFNLSQPSQTFCTVDCPCADGEGGCSDSTQCDPGLTCYQDRGPAVGLPTSYDLCLSACSPFDNTKQNNSFCTAQCPCGLGEGDCDSDAHCTAGLCIEDNGATYGLPATWEACECPAFSTAAPRGNFCSVAGCGTCGVGEGDCDSDLECDPGLICVRAGASYGLPSTYDVCSAGAVLTALTSSIGTVSPAVAPGVLNYTVTIGLTDQTITLTPTASSGATMTIEGSPATSGAAWVSPTLNLGSNDITIVLSQGGVDTTYTVTVIRGGAQDAYIKSSNANQGDRFGVSVAIDGNTMVVGAHREDSSATGVNGDESDGSAVDSGAAYVFVKNAGVWSQQAYLKASNTDAGDQFGLSVAISGDTILVGAAQERSNATGVNGDESNDTVTAAGAAYVFVRNAGVWTQQAYLKASNTDASDQFGWAVAVSGDTAVVGARFEDGNATTVNGDGTNNTVGNAGAAYVFVRSGNVWSQEAYVKPTNPGASDNFAWSVAISGDTIAVRSMREDSNAVGINGDGTNNSALESGAVYVFARSAGVWTQQAYIKASNSEAGDNFGTSVAIDGDTLVVGSVHEDSASSTEGDNSALDAGAAYVFTRSAGIWSQVAYLKASNAEAGDNFGAAVAVSGNVIMVTANLEDSSATGVNGNQSDNGAVDSGAAYVFALSGTWSQAAYLKPSNTGAGDEFGVSVAATPSIYVVGAAFEASNATGIGGNQSDNSALGASAVYSFK